MKIKSNVKAGLMPVEITEMTVHFNVTASSGSGNVASVVQGAINHNQTVARGLKVKSGVKAGTDIESGIIIDY
jgi:hypothetical protein